MDEYDRRSALALFGAGAVFPAGLAQAAAPEITMWRDPGCGCCEAWAQRIEAAFGAKVRIIDARDMEAIKTANRVPVALRSCHTALINRLVVEGHVPPADIKPMSETGWRHGIHGLAVAGMPAGAPGMDVGHNARQPYKVMAFDAEGRSFLYANHG